LGFIPSDYPIEKLTEEIIAKKGNRPAVRQPKANHPQIQGRPLLLDWLRRTRAHSQGCGNSRNPLLFLLLQLHFASLRFELFFLAKRTRLQIAVCKTSTLLRRGICESFFSLRQIGLIGP
jgi:hypothetical protein